MKIKLILLSLAVMLTTLTIQAQTAEEIIHNYFKNTGGADNWRALTGMKNKAVVNNQGLDIPLTLISLKDGRSIMKFELQGKEFVQTAFDGTIAWGTNFMTMEAEKSDNEATENIRRESGDFPDPFLDYKDKGYRIKLIGKETVESIECFKIMLTKKTRLVEGAEVDNISFYFFNIENFLPLVVEQEIQTGEQKGMISQVTFSNYQLVEGLYFAFSISQGIKDMGSQTINFTSVELNPIIDDEMFSFPTSTADVKD